LIAPPVKAILARVDAALNELAEVRRQIVALIPPAAVNGAGAKDADDCPMGPTSRKCTDARQWTIRGRTSATAIRRRKKKMLEAFPALRLLETKFKKTDIWDDLQCIEASIPKATQRAPGGLARSGVPFEAYRMDFCREPPGPLGPLLTAPYGAWGSPRCHGQEPLRCTPKSNINAEV
jgi:hypothetical protein